MLNRLLITTFSLILLLFSVKISVAHTDDKEVCGSEYLNLASEKLLEGLFSEGLEYLLTMAEQMDAPDYYTGHEIISLITKLDIRDAYEFANAMYLWGLESDYISDCDVKVLEASIKYHAPFLSRREIRHWNSLLEERNTDLLKIQKRFWNQKDLTPSSVFNERLIEHWERVAFSKVNFNTSTRSSFDERGDIYIRYGSPTRSTDGRFMYDAGFVNYLAATRLDDGGGSFDVASEVNTMHYLNTIYQVRSYHMYPQYEVWVYEGMLESQESVIFLFGNALGGNVMRRKQSVDDFIPSAAYQTGSRNRTMNLVMDGNRGALSADQETERTQVGLESERGAIGNPEVIPPALIMQIMYYRQLASLDHFFGTTYDQMMSRYESLTDRIQPSLARNFQQVNASRMILSQSRAPEQRSFLEEVLPEVNVEVFTYRFLNEDRQPILRAFVEGRPEAAIAHKSMIDGKPLSEISAHDYSLLATMQMLDRENDIIGVLRDSLSISENGERDIASIVATSKEIPHVRRLNQLRMSMELHEISPQQSSRISDSGPFRNNLKGLGRKEIKIPEYLPIGEPLALSDFIFSYVSDPDADDDETRYAITHKRIIPEASNLQFYYEVYDIPVNSEQLYQFELTYRITPISRRFSLFGLRNRSSDAITIVNINDRPDFSQSLEIDTERLSSGRYELHIEYKVPDTEISRTVTHEFEIE